MLLVYTGNGKGKTSACVGQAVRAMGQEMRVAFAQFMKRDGQAGEQRMLAELLGDRFFAGGEGFFRREEDRPAHVRAAAQVLAWAEGMIPEVDMLVLDEALYALGAGLLSQEQVQGIIEKCAEAGCHLVLSGRGAPEWLTSEADIVSEIVERRHVHARGGRARRGIEF